MGRNPSPGLYWRDRSRQLSRSRHASQFSRTAIRRRRTAGAVRPSCPRGVSPASPIRRGHPRRNRRVSAKVPTRRWWPARPVWRSTAWWTRRHRSRHWHRPKNRHKLEDWNRQPTSHDARHFPASSGITLPVQRQLYKTAKPGGAAVHGH